MTQKVQLPEATTATEQLINMWVHGKSANTAELYRRSAKRFLEFVGKPLHLVSLAEVQAFADNLAQEGRLKASSQRSILSAVKSLLSFATKTGVLAVNVGALVNPPKAKDTLNEKLLSEMEVMTMIAQETDVRNRAILRALYLLGLRVSELCDLKWKDLQPRPNGGQVTVFGKGSKTRIVLVPASLWVELMQLFGDASNDEPVFRSRKHNHSGHLSRIAVYEIVREAAKRADIKRKVSPHFLRHAHASHSLDRGAPIHLVQQTLGHSSVGSTSRYLHARPSDSSSLYLPG
jgi:integrase/recombinase XerD